MATDDDIVGDVVVDDVVDEAVVDDETGPVLAVAMVVLGPWGGSPGGAVARMRSEKSSNSGASSEPKSISEM